MATADHLVCPSCAAPLPSVHAVRLGKKIACPRCGIAFTVRPEDAGKGGSVNRTRLGIVLAGAFVYLLGGAGLTLYCVTHNAAATTEVRADSGAGAADDSVLDVAAPPEVLSAPQPGAVSAAEQRKINDAIVAGVWFLRDQARPDGGWWDGGVGFAALPGLTLLECGVPANDPIIQRTAARVRREVLTIGGDRYGTYQLALALLFLDRLGAYEDDDLIRYLALCLIAGQDADEGAWHYNCPMLERARVPELLRALDDSQQTLADWRRAALPGGGFDTHGWDNSNTQFALLALWVTSRHRVPIDRPIALLERHFRTTQLGEPGGPRVGDPNGNNVDLNGSWYYDTPGGNGRNSSRWPSMTCSGLIGLAVAHGVTRDPTERKQKPLDDPAIRRGLAMLARELDRPDEKRPPDLYYLWSLQRVGVLFALDKLDGKAWYPWGVHILLPRQQNDGSWHDGGYVGSQPLLDTCFALLFLKQANLASDLTEKLELLAQVLDRAPSAIRSAPRNE